MTTIKGFDELCNVLIGKAEYKDKGLSNKAKALKLNEAIHAKKEKDCGVMLQNMAAMVLELPTGKSENDRLKDGILWPAGRNYRDEAKSAFATSFKAWAKKYPAFTGKAIKWDNESRSFTFKAIVEKSVEEKLEKLFPGLDQKHYNGIIKFVADCKADIEKDNEKNRAEIHTYKLNTAIVEDVLLMTARGETVEQAIHKAAIMNNSSVETVQAIPGVVHIVEKLAKVA